MKGKNHMHAWFPVCQRVVPADFEHWLENLALKGWIPKNVGQFSFIRMSFAKSDPKKYRYIFDLQAAPRKDYVSTYRKFGWELVGRMSSAFLWRQEYEGFRPESFSDGNGILSRNKRVIAAVSVSFSLFLLAAVATAVPLIFFSSAPPADKRLPFFIFLIFCILASLSLGAVMLKIFKKRDE